MRVIAEVEIRCRDHDSFNCECRLGCLSKKAENNVEALLTRRSSLLLEIKRHLSSRELIIIDVK
jgi:hypothetical protein